MLGSRRVLAAHVPSLMDGDALAAMENLDSAGDRADVDFGADQRVRDRIEKVEDVDVIVEVDARLAPFRELPIVGGQGCERVALDLLEQREKAQAQVAHGKLFSAA